MLFTKCFCIKNGKEISCTMYMCPNFKSLPSQVFWHQCNRIMDKFRTRRSTSLYILPPCCGTPSGELQGFVPDPLSFGPKWRGMYHSKLAEAESWTYNFAEVSGHNLESCKTLGFCIQCSHYKPVSNHFCSKLLEVTVNSKEENPEDFCPNYVQEFGLWIAGRESVV
jgi:hypothetical protein